MAVTRSRSVERAEVRRVPGRHAGWRSRELVWTLAASLLVGTGLYLVYQAKSQPLPAIEQGLASKKLLNLNALAAREDLLPALSVIPSTRDRQEAARKIYYLSGTLPNVGGIRAMMTGDQFRLLKPLLVVRAPGRFRTAFVLWVALFFAAFLLAHVW